tara:strand:+ start:1558 stop:3318 length:1761 start_codon:yes stop_codon:yes gene_type:complete
MATRYNPYAMDANLSAGISNLTKALIGSASDDAAIARGKASMASAGASNALTRLRNEQTKGEAQKTKLAEAFNQYGDAIVNDPEAVKRLAGLVLPMSEYVEKDVSFDDPLISKGQGVSPGMASAIMGDISKKIPYKGEAPINYSEEALKGIVGSMFGNEPSNMNQATAGWGNIQEMAKNKLIENLVLDSDQSKDRMAYILSGKSPGQFFDKGSAKEFAELTSQTKKEVQEIKETGLTSRHVKGLENNITLEKIRELGKGKRQESQLLNEKYIANEEIKHKSKVSKMELALKEEMSRLKIDQENATKKLIAEKKLEQKTANDQKKLELEKEIAEIKEANRVKIAKMTDSTKRWEFKNRTLTATYDEVLIVSEEYALEKGIAKQTEGRYKGLYTIDGGQDPSKKMVKLNANQTVYMSEELANDFGIDVNEQGQFKAEGITTKDPTKDSQIAFDKFAEQFQNDIEVFTTEGELPNNHVMGQMRTIFYDSAKSLMESSNISWADAYNQVKGKMLTGTTEIGGGVLSSGEFVPNFILDSAIAMELAGQFTAQKQGAFVKNLSQRYKYNEDVIEGIIKYIANESVRRQTSGY